MTEKIINSISDLIDDLKSEESNCGSLWFRGHADASWELKPGIYRYTPLPSEQTLLKKFKQSAAMLIGMPPQDTFDWLFLMQHYGVPTRLLDWSESPLTALYFAVAEDNNQDKDGALWLLHPTQLNRNANIFGDEEFFIPSFEDIELTNYTVESVSQDTRSQLFPLATIATRNNPRIQAQLGVFTIHHRQDCSLESIGNADHVKKYIIPSSKKSNILLELGLLGINKFQLFPELSSVGDILKGDLT